MAKVLFSTVTYPIPFTDPYGASWTDALAQRFSKGQGIFTLSGHQHCVGPELIAQNISAASIFLEYPTAEIFASEIRKGYDYVGITFFPHHTEQLLEMCETVRRLAPATKIVVGGYGAMGIPDAFESDEARKRLIDHVCIGDGVRFFRELLGDPIDADVEQRLLPCCSMSLPWIDRYPKGDTGFVIAGLGCPVGCDFCSTTVMHAGKRIQYAGPEKIFSEMKRYYQAQKNMQMIMVYDEDFMRYRDQVLELGELIRSDTEFGLRDLGYFTLGSINTLSQYTWEELALSGLEFIFIGVESKFAPEQGYTKRSGRSAEEVFQNLHRIGIATLAGWVCGFDFHDRRSVWEDLDYVVSLSPTGHQFTRLSPFPGTALYDQLTEDDRVYPGTSWKDFTFYGDEGGMIHKNFLPHEINEIIDVAYRKMHETWGPFLMRQLQVSLNGFEYCRASEHPALREAKAERHLHYAEGLYCFVEACERFAPNDRVRTRIRRLEHRYRQVVGEPSRSQRALSKYALVMAYLESVREAVSPRARKPRREPTKIYEFGGNLRALDELERPYRVKFRSGTSGSRFIEHWSRSGAF